MTHQYSAQFHSALRFEMNQGFFAGLRSGWFYKYPADLYSPSDFQILTLLR